jgi:hypothetical protein
MTNYWYVARPNELFIDTDNISKSIKHTRARLQGAIESNRLNVSHVISKISSPGHLHTIITLNESMPSIDRFVWEIILHGDIYRGCCNIMRWIHSVPSTDILISQHDRFCFLDTTSDFGLRWPDDECDCIGKHKASVMQTCPAAIRLRGKHRTAAFFGKPSKNPCKIWDVTL